MKPSARPAFYALQSGGWKDYVTILHIPYTVWNLSYVALGAAIAPLVHIDRLLWTVLAFFLAVGLASHALDELRGRPLNTRLSDGSLIALAASSLIGAIAIGVVASLVVSPWTILFVAFGGFAVVAYNLEMVGGKFHSDFWFAFFWGAFPPLVGYWANAEHISLQALLVAGAAFVLSLAQRNLSTPVRKVRRRVQAVSGWIEFSVGEREAISTETLIGAPESALKLMSISIALLAVGLLIARL